MNALYGYPTAGPQVLSGMAHMGQMDSALGMAYKIATGQARGELETLKAENQRIGAQLDAARAGIDAMPSGQAKNAALAVYDTASRSFAEQYATYVQIRETYNQIVTEVNARTTGAALQQMSGLGVAPVTAVIVMAAAALLIAQLVNLMGAWRGQANATRGYLDQLAGVIAAGGGAVKDIGAGLSSIAWAAVVGVGAFFLYKLVKSGRAEQATSTALAKISGPALKPVTGTVL